DRDRRVQGQAGPGAGVGDEGLGDVGEGAGPADAVVQRHGLHRIVAVAVDVAQHVGHLDAARAAGVEVELQVGRAGGAAALHGDHRVGDVELADRTGVHRVRVGL